jgi:hypothetical protein
MERRAQRGRRNVPKAAAKVTSASGGIADNTRTCRWLDLVANDPKETLTFELQDHDRRRHLLGEISANAIQRVVCF